MLPVDSTVSIVTTIVSNVYAVIAAVTTILGALSALIGHHIGFKKGIAAMTDKADPKSGRL